MTCGVRILYPQHNLISGAYPIFGLLCQWWGFVVLCQPSNYLIVHVLGLWLSVYQPPQTNCYFCYSVLVCLVGAAYQPFTAIKSSRLPRVPECIFGFVPVLPLSYCPCLSCMLTFRYFNAQSPQICLHIEQEILCELQFSNLVWRISFVECMQVSSSNM